METVFRTDVGQLREHNEDAGGIFQNQAGDYLAVVADGMGGHQAGDVASQMAKDLLKNAWEPLEHSFTPEKAEEWLRDQIQTVNESIFRKAEASSSLRGMGTTIVAAICTSSFVAIAHVGDSRAYFFNGQELLLKTEDHSLVNELKKNGQLTEEEAENHPRKNVLLRALGTEEQTKIERVVFEWVAGEGVLLCSDGLTNKVSAEDFSEILLSDLPLTEQAEEIIHMANERGGEDNITLAAVLHSPDEKGLT
ncbi:Stp1/IreP family PP2C-type Ser/Thr phosphatase [Bacillus piscicola]|uniref:Stp1/IreP family PP2C-type Ser/Thr phosphatase n=1 Tax=Bacillus piscicola TaxID=1632684 RepID=UPI001F08B59B